MGAEWSGQQAAEASSAGAINLAEAARVQQYLSQFGITGWVGRDVTVAAGAAGDTGDEINKTSLGTTDISKNITEPADISKNITEATDISKNITETTGDEINKTSLGATDISKNITGTTDISKNITEPGNISKNIRLGAIVYEEVLVVYKLERQAQLQADERQLLENMLAKCGIQPNHHAKEQLLSFPPLLPHIAGSMHADSDSEQAWQDCCTGFISALLQSGSSQHKPVDYILLLGDEVHALLPQQVRGGKQQCLVIKNLRTMLDDPKTRKHTWELLAPLREHLAAAA